MTLLLHILQNLYSIYGKGDWGYFVCEEIQNRLAPILFQLCMYIMELKKAILNLSSMCVLLERAFSSFFFFSN